MDKVYATKFGDSWPLSRLVFGWLDPLVLKAVFKTPTADQLNVENQDLTEVASQKFDAEWERQLKSCKPSLFMALLKCFYWDVVVSGLYKLMWSCLLCLCAFFFVRELTKYVGDASAPLYQGWLLCVGNLVACLALSFTYQQMVVKSTQVGIRMRGAILCALYEKAMKLDLQELNAGDVVNLATNDCSRLLEACVNFHYLWSSVLECIAIIGLLIYLVGHVGWIAMGIIVVLIVIQCVIGFLIAALRSKNINTTDARVSMMTEILMAIKLVKLYAWEDFFSKHVRTIRRREVLLIGAGAIIKSINLLIVFGVPTVISLAIFGAYVSVVGKLDAAVGFTTLSLFNTLRFPLVGLPKALRGFSEFVAGLYRLEAFLLKDEINIHPKDPVYRGILMENASFSYLHTENLLHDLSFEIPQGKLCGMIGLVGTGKSNLVYAILGQMKLSKGSYTVGGKIALVPQTPWVQNGTIRDNILFGQPYDEERYKRTVYACALVRDFELMANGDMTVLSDRGQNLSGGQKQRLAIARAAYSHSDIYILDSPLSAVDQHTSKHIFDHCIRGVMRGKTVILITHHLDLLADCDLVSVMDGGKMSYFGEWNEKCINVLQGYFPSWVHIGHDHHEEPQQPIEQPVEQANIENPSIQIEQVDVVVDNATTNEEDVLAPPLSSKDISIDDYTLAQSTSADALLTNEIHKEEKPTTDALMMPSDSVYVPQASDDSIPKSKIPFMGHLVWVYECNAFFALFSLLAFAGTQTIRIISDRWIGWWTSSRYPLSEGTYIWIYAILIIVFMVGVLVRGILYYAMVLRATTKLHNKMFKRVLRAPMLFFNETPVGRVLNCFSKDQDCADEALSDSIHMTTIYLMILLTTIILVCVTIPYYTIVLGVLLGSFVLFYVLYSSAAQYLKEEAGTSNSSIFAHLNESLTGLIVIRAFEDEKRFTTDITGKINTNHGAVFLSEMLNMWLSFRLDCISSVLVFVTAIFAVTLKGKLTASAFGLAISNSFQQLVFFTWVVRGFAEINSQIACMERISFFANNTKTEAPARIKKTEPAADWPQAGAVEIQNLVLRYSPKLDPVLKGVSISINGGEKIGVVGRTGSGKTTLLMSLFRLIEPDSGIIKIDGVDIMPLGLNDLRSKIAIIPQEPVLFKGTIRTNLDPFGRIEDRDIWEALACANMKEEIEKLPKQLESPVLEGGSNYSLGQKQLICLSRAVLNKSKLLVFDEATAAMDSQTDAEIQKTIRKVFAERTILTIAHRLETIIDSDRILVMDAGQVIEFDTPANLLSNPNGSFTRLVDQTGPDTSAALRKVAFGK